MKLSRHLTFVVISTLLSTNLFAGESLKPLDNYQGIHLIESDMNDVIGEFGKTELFKFPQGHAKGLCYQSKDGLSVLFSSDASGRLNYITGITITKAQLSFPCSTIKETVSNCFGKICIGKTLAQIQRAADMKFEKINAEVDSWGTKFEFSGKLPSWKKAQGGDTLAVDYLQTLRLHFGSGGADGISILRLGLY